jgi:hypothetical protein
VHTLTIKSENAVELTFFKFIFHIYILLHGDGFF